jgi:hypothetical protein
MARTVRKPPAKRFSLYWCTTSDGGEDWFVVAASAAAARRFHEHAEGYHRGDADAERVAALPPELLVDGGWRDGKKRVVSREAGWPSDELLVACGGEIARQPTSELQRQVGAVAKDVRFGDRVFRAGDIVENVARARGIKTARLSAFQGGKAKT